MKTKHLPLIVGISLPIIFIVIISIVIFTPSLFIKPQHNFVYTTEDSYYAYNQEYQNIYKVENGRIVLEPVPPRENIVQTKISPTLYLYDVKTNSSIKLLLKKYKIISLIQGHLRLMDTQSHISMVMMVFSNYLVQTMTTMVISFLKAMEKRNSMASLEIDIIVMEILSLLAG